MSREAQLGGPTPAPRGRIRLVPDGAPPGNRREASNSLKWAAELARRQASLPESI